MTNNTNQGPVEGGLPSLSLPLPPPQVYDEAETVQVYLSHPFNG